MTHRSCMAIAVAFVVGASPAFEVRADEIVQQIATKYKDTGDIAGAAEELVNRAGKQFSYEDTPEQGAADSNVGLVNVTPRNILDRRRMICYEFIHYAAYLAGPQRVMGSGTVRIGATDGGVIRLGFTSGDKTRWDGTSDIPRGKLIIWVHPGEDANNSSGYYHIGVSLGNGKVAHLTSLSPNAQIANYADVASNGGYETYIADYNWSQTGMPAALENATTPGTPGTGGTPSPPSTPSTPSPPSPPPTPAPGGTGGGSSGTDRRTSINVLPSGSELLARNLDAAVPGLRLADQRSCCGDPLGHLLGIPAANTTSKFQLFVTGGRINRAVNFAQSGRDDALLPPVVFAGLSRVSWWATAAATLQALRRPQRPAVELVATGASTGDAFLLRVAGESGYRGQLMAADGLVLEATTRTAPSPRAASTTDVSSVPAFCAEFEKSPPPPGTVYRVASPQTQERLKPMRQLFRAADQLAAAGKLHPDSNPQGYLNFVKQYSMWTRLEGWNQREFLDSFIEKTKESMAAAGRPWSSDAEAQLRKAAPGRWADIQAVIETASRR